MKKTLYNIVTEIEKKYNVSLSEDKLQLIDDIIPLILDEKVSFVKFYKAVIEMAEHQKGLIKFHESVNALQLAEAVFRNNMSQGGFDLEITDIENLYNYIIENIKKHLGD